MAEYLVKVADERGSVHERVEAGVSATEVRERVAQQGLHVFSVRERGLLSGGEARLGRGRVTLQDFVVFNQQFVTLVRAGLPILTALDLLSRQQRKERFKNVINNVRERVRNGESLSSAVSTQPVKVIDRIYTTTLAAGEKSGNLEELLSRYINLQRVTLSFRKRVITSLFYPALLVIAIVVMFVVLMTVVVPRFAELYSQLKVPLPPTTAFLLAVGERSQIYVPVFAAILIGAFFFLYRWQKTPGGGTAVDRWRLKVPVFGNIYEKYQVAAFARMLSTLLAGGIPLVQSLETAASALTSRTLATTASQAAVRVREGRSLARSLSEGERFPALAIEMIEVGESTGALPAMLTSVAEFFEEDVQNALTAALSLIEPLILVLMGLVVGFVLISLYLPIFSIGASGAGGI